MAAVGLGLFRRTMDGLPFSVLLLDDDRRMVYANRRAQARLQAGDGVVDVRGRLSVGGPDREAFETGWNALRVEPLGAAATSSCMFAKAGVRSQASLALALALAQPLRLID